MSEATLRLKQIMEEKNITQSELASKSGVDQSHISRYLSGKYEPKSVQAQKLANVLGVSPVWLMGIEGVDRNNNPDPPTYENASPAEIQEALELLKLYKSANLRDRSLVDSILKSHEP